MKLKLLSRRLSLSWRVTLFSFSLLALLLIILGTVISILEEQAGLANQSSLLKTRARITSFTGPKELSQVSTISLAVVKSQMESIQAAIGNETGVAMLSLDGNLILADNRANIPTVRLSPDDVKAWRAANSEQFYLLRTDNQGQRELVILEPIFVLDKVNLSYMRVYLQLSTSTSPVDQMVVTTRLSLLVGILCTLVVAAIVTPPLMRKALRPLAEMEQATGRIAGGELSLRLAEAETHDEVGRLALAFNSMVARLEKAFARQRQFVADVSHELRTPLTGLSGSLEMLMLEADKGNEQAAQRLMRGMYGEVGRMHRLVADLLILSRLDEGQFKVGVSEVDMACLLAEVYEQAQHLALGQQIVCNISAPLASVRGSADQLRRVLLNIVENALKFTPTDGRIALTASSENGQNVCISISDTGIGIPEEALPYIFDRFYRVDPSRTRLSAQGGSGLGLSIAREIVQAHAGTITVDSTPGQGTRIALRLPAQFLNMSTRASQGALVSDDASIVRHL
jgi:heavy metal sensor kinase